MQKPRDPPEHELNKLGMLFNQGKFEQALDYSSVLARKYPGSVIVYNLAGAANGALTRLEDALVSFDNAIRLDPSYADAHSNRGNALQGLDRLDEALASYNKAIQLRPNYADAYNNRGNVLQ